IKKRHLQKVHDCIFGETAENMLRALKYEIPTKMRKTENVLRWSFDGVFHSLTRLSLIFEPTASNTQLKSIRESFGCIYLFSGGKVSFIPGRNTLINLVFIMKYRFSIFFSEIKIKTVK